MKRFYKLVSIDGPKDGRYAVMLDGKPVKTPSGAPLAVAPKPLAEAIMEEWARQDGTIKPDSMPLTQIATTMIDRVRPARVLFESAVLDYLDTDLLCYRAEKPSGLPERQAELWSPWLDWFQKRTGVALKTTTALKALKQPPAAHECAAAMIKALDDGRMSVLQLAVSLTGSFVLGLALTERAATAQDVYNAFMAEENWRAGIYNEAVYGADPQEEKRRAGLRRDLDACAQFAGLCPQEP